MIDLPEHRDFQFESGHMFVLLVSFIVLNEIRPKYETINPSRLTAVLCGQ